MLAEKKHNSVGEKRYPNETKTDLVTKAKEHLSVVTILIKARTA